MDSRTRSATQASPARTVLKLVRAPIKPECAQGYQAHRDAGQIAVWDVGGELPTAKDPGPLIGNPNCPAPRLGVEPKYLGVRTRLVHPWECASSPGVEHVM